MKKPRQLKEWHRTLILFVLLAVGLSAIYLLNNNVQTNFVEQIEQSSGNSES